MYKVIKPRIMAGNAKVRFYSTTGITVLIIVFKYNFNNHTVHAELS